MYRERIQIRLKNAHQWNKALELCSQLNAIAADRGWAQATVWTQTVGTFNELVFESEYPDLATYERERAAFYADEQAIGLAVQFDEITIEGTGHNELWEQAEPVEVLRP